MADLRRPCADALPPTPHSHTFWADGTFNSHDERGKQVDDDRWAITGKDMLTIGKWTFSYAISGDALMLEPVVPPDCTGQCSTDLGWMYSVSFPGSAWHRVTTDPHDP